MLNLAIHNPPKRTKKAKAKRRKSRRRPTPAQIEARRRFVEMVRARAKKTKRRGSKSRTRTKRPRVVAASSRRATTMPRSRSRSVRVGRRRGRRGGGGFARRGFSVKEMLPTVGGALVGFIAANKLPDYLPASIRGGSDVKRMAVKAGIGVAAFLALRAARQHKLAGAVLTGAAVNVLYDAVKKAAPQIAAGSSLNGIDDESMGEMFNPALMNGDGMGEMFEPANMPALRAA